MQMAASSSLTDSAVSLTPEKAIITPDKAIITHVPTEVRLPRGAKLEDYDLAHEEDHEVWAKNKLKVIKGRKTLIAELKAQATADDQAYQDWLAEAKRRQEEGTLSDMSDLSDLEDDQQHRRKRIRADGQAPAPVVKSGEEPTGSAHFAINCGLYSAQYQAGITHIEPNRRAVIGPILPLPVHYGRALIETEREFELPVPMLRQRTQLLASAGPLVSKHIHDLLPDDKRPPAFIRIRASASDLVLVLTHADEFPERHQLSSERIAVCACKPGDACGDDCINRMMKYLCSPQLCPAGESCTNQPFSMRRGFNEHLRICWSQERGFGLQCVKDIPAGAFVMQYVGEVIFRESAFTRSVNEYSGTTNFYMLEYDGQEVIDAGMKGNDARFINHSCAPLLVVERWRLADMDEFEIGMFANEAIAAGTELSYDYGFQAFSSLQSPGKTKVATDTVATEVTDHAKEQRCYCGATTCRGFLSARKASERAEPKGRAAARAAKAGASKMARMETDAALAALR